jgi:hypothetical protein
MLRMQLPLVWMRVHVDRRQVSASIVGSVLELDPVVLDVLARGEVAVAAVVARGRRWASLRS